MTDLNMNRNRSGLNERLRNHPIWCGFSDDKHPYSLDGIRGIGVDTPRDRLGTYEQAKSLGYPYVGISFTAPIKVDGKYLICLDFDWKRSPSKSPEIEQTQLMEELDAFDAASETSHSHLGAHYWILADENEIPASMQLKNGCEIEVFSGLPGQVANVLVTDFDATGSLVTVDLTLRLPKRVVVDRIIGNKLGNSAQTEHGCRELIRALSYISPNDYWTWLRIGMALRYELGDAGFEVWNQWSTKDDKYDSSEMAYKWNSFLGHGVTAGTIIRYAQEGGYVYQRETKSANDDFGMYVDPETGERIGDSMNLRDIWSSRVVKAADHMIATDWVIDELISEKLTIIAGAPGIGKTTCLFGVFATAAGFKDMDSPLKATFRRQILWVSEHPEQIQQLMEAISKKYVGNDGFPLYLKEEINQWILVIEAFRANVTELSALGNFAIDYSVIDEAGNQIEPLVILDTANACLDLEDENKNSEVGKYVSAIKEHLIKRHIPVVLIAHTPKAVQKKDFLMLTARGAGAFEGDAHATGFVFQDSDIGARVFKMAKRRYRISCDEYIFRSDSLLTTAIDRRGRSVATEVDIAMPRLSSEVSRAEMVIQAQELRAREAEVAKIQDLELKSMQLLNWLCRKGQVSINEIRAAKLPGLTDKRMIKAVLDQMLDKEMATCIEGLRGNQKTMLYAANKGWSAYNYPN
jgi:hypothetical protein